MKNVIVLTFVLLLAVGVSAQRIGIKAGANFAGMQSNTPTPNAKLLTGLHIGAVYDHKIIPMLWLRGAVLMSQKGYAVKGTETTSGVDVASDYKTKLNYAELQVQAKVKLGPLYAVAGPYFSYGLSAKTTGTVIASASGTVVSTTDLDVNLFDSKAQAFNKTDVGLNVGIGLEFGLGPLHSFAELNYGQGLSNIMYKPANSDYARNMVIGLSLGVMLGF